MLPWDDTFLFAAKRQWTRRLKERLLESVSWCIFLNSAKRNSTSIGEFRRSLKELLVDLTLTQAEGNEQIVKVLRLVNERIAIRFFANGLNNQNLGTIIKGGNVVRGTYRNISYERE